MISCRKKTYEPYIGDYDCLVTYHLDSPGYNLDSVYYETESIIEVDSKTIQFQDLPVPYKYISDEGYFADENFVPGFIWGRQLTLRNDSLIYLHHESSSTVTWSIKFEGKRL